MASIDQLKASDGSGNASVATVQSSRAPAASTIIVDTVLNINTNFIGTMGTPHTFTDPITSETITVISEATAVDFKGHVDGSNLEIDEIAPGYTDAGSAIGDIVIIRPTTQYGDKLAEVLEVSHNDNGTLKTNTVDTTQLVAGAVTPDKLDTGANSSPLVTTDESTSSTSYTDLTTTTDTITVTIGANGIALVGISASLYNTVVTGHSKVSFDVSGANTLAAADSRAINFQAALASGVLGLGAMFLLTGLNPGSTTFKMKYAQQVAGVAHAFNRKIVVVPL